jgi:hypothetical protein
MKIATILLTVLVPALTWSKGKGLEVEKEKIDISAKQKVELCQDFADEKYCGSKINEESCHEDFSFKGSIEHLKNMPNVLTLKKFTLTSKGRDLKFSKKETYKVQFEDGEFKSRYGHESYSTYGKDQSSHVPSFILDSSCKGDDDSDD